METNTSFSNTLTIFANKHREYLDAQDKLNGKFFILNYKIYPHNNFLY